jgi:hypothetical protein
MTLNINAVVQGLFLPRFDSAGAGRIYFKDTTGFMIEKPACILLYLCDDRRIEKLKLSLLIKLLVPLQDERNNHSI